MFVLKMCFVQHFHTFILLSFKYVRYPSQPSSLFDRTCLGSNQMQMFCTQNTKPPCCVRPNCLQCDFDTCPHSFGNDPWCLRLSWLTSCAKSPKKRSLMTARNAERRWANSSSTTLKVQVLRTTTPPTSELHTITRVCFEGCSISPLFSRSSFSTKCFDTYEQRIGVCIKSCREVRSLRCLHSQSSQADPLERNVEHSAF